jgi:hypothetical protein
MNTCFARTNGISDCKHVKHCSERHHMACFHPNKKMHDRTANQDAGRGVYCYPLYDVCDCGGYEPIKKSFNIISWIKRLVS